MLRAADGIVGGVFGLEDPRNFTPGRRRWLRDGDLHLASARSGLALLVDTLQPRNTWLPAFLCPVLVEALSGLATTVRFYEVEIGRPDTQPDWKHILTPSDLVLAIDYFGFPAPVSPDLVRAEGCWYVEDASQAMLSSGVGTHSDFVLFSPRKFVGVPDGGILRCNTEIDLTEVALSPPPQDWWLTALAATLGRQVYDRHGGERQEWFRLSQKAETTAPASPHAMSDLTKALLDRAVDFGKIAELRRQNYATLLKHLRAIALVPELPSGVVPLGFPIRLQRRDELRAALISAQIFTPVHWDLGDTVPTEFQYSHRLAREILTVPCDQRYGEAEMLAVAERICGFLV